VVAVRYVEDMEKTTPAEVDRGEMAVARVKARCQGKTQNRRLAGNNRKKPLPGNFWRLGDVCRNPPRFVFRERLGRREATAMYSV
jgi:hypothetical protein